MKKYILSIIVLCLVQYTAMAQLVIFEDDFESYEDFSIENVGDWILYDNDGYEDTTGFADVTFPNLDEMTSFIVFNPFETDPPIDTWAETYNWDFSPKSGEKYMLAKFSWGGASSDWLISPAIELPEINDLELSFFIKSPSGYFPNESFNVWVSTTDTDVASFEQIASELMEVGKEWVEFSYSLDDFAGETIFVGIEYTSDNLFGLLVDDFMVTGEEAMSTFDLNSKNLTVYPNPVSDVFQINLPSKFNENKMELTIKDLTGKNIKTFEKATYYDISNLPKGVYILEMNDGKEKLTQRIIKK